MERLIRFSLTAVLLVLTAFGMGACADNKASNERLLCSYESYDDLLTIDAQNTLFGSISVNDDAAYVSHGKHSAHLRLQTGNQGQVNKVQSFFCRAADPLSPFLLPLDKTEYVALDVYNAFERDLTLYIGFEDDQTPSVTDEKRRTPTDGAVLAAKGWTRVTFDVKPWFYTEGDVCSKMTFYLHGYDYLADTPADLYIDNLRVKQWDAAKAPTYIQPTERVSAGGMPLLTFDRESDGKMIRTAFDGVWNSSCALYADFDPYATVGGRQGALHVMFDGIDGLHPNYSWTGAHHYLLELHRFVTDKLVGAQSVSVLCHNPGTVTQYVSFRFTYADVNGRGEPIDVTRDGKVTAVPGGQTVRVVCDDAAALASSYKSVSVGIESFRGNASSELYFADMRYEL